MSKEQYLAWLRAKLAQADYDTQWDTDPGEAYWDAYYHALDSVYTAAQRLEGDD